MNILMMEWNGFGYEDMTDAFSALGHSVFSYPFSNKELHSDSSIEAAIKSEAKEKNAEIVFSFNYFPIIAKVCHDEGLPYFAWVYDSPAALLYHFSLVYPTNHVFLFDYEEYKQFKDNGINTVYYLPLAANPERLTNLINDEDQRKSFERGAFFNKTDIAFVGSLYTENHNFYERLQHIKPFTRGYLEGIMASQKQVYGVNFIKELLSDDIIEDMYKELPLMPNPESLETKEYLFAEYVINRKLTATERLEYLSKIGESRNYDLYTPNKNLLLPGSVNHGAVDHLNIAPFVYNHAKINLNISLRSIHSGIPLRCFEIMASGGLLLSNFQSGFADCFNEGDELVCFESAEDMLMKIDYLLSHEDERKQIAENGYNRLVKEHTFLHRAEEMLSHLG